MRCLLVGLASGERCPRQCAAHTESKLMRVLFPRIRKPSAGRIAPGHALAYHRSEIAAPIERRCIDIVRCERRRGVMPSTRAARLTMGAFTWISVRTSLGCSGRQLRETLVDGGRDSRLPAHEPHHMMVQSECIFPHGSARAAAAASSKRGARFRKTWCCWRGLNSRPLPYQGPSRRNRRCCILSAFRLWIAATAHYLHPALNRRRAKGAAPALHPWEDIPRFVPARRRRARIAAGRPMGSQH